MNPDVHYCIKLSKRCTPLMILSTKAILLISVIPTVVLAVLASMKVLRHDKLIAIIAVLALLLASLGLLIRPENTSSSSLYKAEFASPLVYILSYALLRYLYKAIYKVEPTYNRMSWYDEEEGRRQNWMDVVVHVLPFLIAIIFPFLFIEK